MPPIRVQFNVQKQHDHHEPLGTQLDAEDRTDGADTHPVLEPLRIPPPDQLRDDTTYKFKIVKSSKSGKSAPVFDQYKSATTPKEYFALHPGRVPGRAVTANAEWKYDVTHGVIVFDNPEHQRLAEYYGMQGEELKNFFDEHPDHHHDAVLRAQRNLLRVLNYSTASLDRILLRA